MSRNTTVETFASNLHVLLLIHSEASDPLTWTTVGGKFILEWFYMSHRLWLIGSKMKANLAGFEILKKTQKKVFIDIQVQVCTQAVDFIVFFNRFWHKNGANNLLTFSSSVPQCKTLTNKLFLNIKFVNFFQIISPPFHSSRSQLHPRPSFEPALVSS